MRTMDNKPVSDEIESDSKLVDYQEPFLNSEQIEVSLKPVNDENEQLEHCASAKKTRFKVKKIDFTMNDQSNDEEVRKDGDKERKSSTNSSTNESHAGSENEYNTQYLKSLRHYTREPLPKGKI